MIHSGGRSSDPLSENPHKGYKNIMKKVTIKFILPYPPYSVGEEATFFEKEANRLLDRGFAMYLSGKPEVETQADRLKALRGVQTKHIPSAPETRHIPGPEETKDAPQGPQTSENGPDETITAPAPKLTGKRKGSGKNKASGSRPRGGKGKK
jgi:hypothetical protein